MFVFIFFFFFFQAEDGIRDVAVTGVQTCALPISTSITPWRRRSPFRKRASPSSATPRTLSEEQGGLLEQREILPTSAKPTSRLAQPRSEEHTSELQSRLHLVCRLLLEKKNISML